MVVCVRTLVALCETVCVPGGHMASELPEGNGICDNKYRELLQLYPDDADAGKRWELLDSFIRTNFWGIVGTFEQDSVEDGGTQPMLPLEDRDAQGSAKDNESELQIVDIDKFPEAPTHSDTLPLGNKENKELLVPVLDEEESQKEESQKDDSNTMEEVGEESKRRRLDHSSQ